MTTNNIWNSQDPAQVAKGMTGRAELTAGHVMVGSGTDPVALVDMTGKGDLLAGDGVGVPQVLDASTDGYVLTLDSAEDTGMKWATLGGGSYPANYRSMFTHFQEFNKIGPDGGSAYYKGLSGVAGTPYLTDTLNHPGIEGGNYHEGLYNLFVGNTGIDLVFNHKAEFPQFFGIDIGFAVGTWGQASLTDGWYFSCFDQNLSNLHAVTRGDSTNTETDLNFTGDTDWHTFRLNINDDATEVKFYVDDSLAATHNTNLPRTSKNYTFRMQTYDRMDYFIIQQAITR